MIVQVDNRRIRVKTKELITAGSKGVDKAEFTFDGAWNGLLRTAVFSDGVHEISIAESQWTDGGCTVPWEVLQSEGNTLTVGVFGVDSSGNVVMPTITATVCVLQPPVNMTAASGQAPTPTIYEQWVADIHSDYLGTVTAKTAAETARTGAETAQDLAQSAKTAAETARTGAETAQDLAQSAQDLAQSAKTDAEAARAGAETAQCNAEAAKGEAEAAQELAENARVESQLASTLAQASQLGAETAKNDATAAATASENARVLAFNASANAQNSAMQAGTYNNSASDAMFAAQSAANAADNAAQSAENSKNLAAQAATNSGYTIFYVDTNGHLIEVRTENVPDDFTFSMNEGRLILNYE